MRTIAALAGAAWLIVAQTAPADEQSGDKPGAERTEAERADDAKSADEEIDEAIGPVLAETLVVTASRSETSLLDAPVSISVVGERELATSPADTYADLLRGVPGLNLVQTSARDVNVKARGATGTLETGQLALVDGRSVYQDFFGFVAWDLLPVSFDEIASVEVLRGPGSAVWGANALNGVVHVRTKSPRELQGGALSLTAGELGTRTASVRWADVRGRSSYKVSASYHEQGAWPRDPTLPGGDPLPPEASYANTGTRQPKLDLRLDHESDAGRTWSYRLGAAASSGVMHTGIGPFQIDDGTVQSYLEIDRKAETFDLKVYVNRMDGDALNLLNGLDFVFDTNVFVAEATARKTLGGHQLVVYGGQARLSRFDLSIAPRGDSRQELGFFVEDQVSVGRWLLGFGVRVDHFDTIGTTVSPRTSAIFKPTGRQSIRLAYNRAYRAPSLVNNYLDTTIQNTVELATGPYTFPIDAEGDAGLSETTVDALEIGYTARLRSTTLSVAAYRNRTRDLVDFYPAEYYSRIDPPPGWPLPEDFVPLRTLPKRFTYRNVGEIVDRGLEVALTVDVTTALSLTLTHALQDEPKIRGDGDEELVLNLPPEQSASVSLRYDSGRRFAALGVSFTDRAFWSDVLDERFWGRTEGFVLVDASFGTRLREGRLELRAGVTNLLDEEARQHVFGDVIGRKVTVGLTRRW